MIDGLLHLFRHRHRPEAAPAVKEAEQLADKQFREWDSVLLEVERVQKLADRSQRRAH